MHSSMTAAYPPRRRNSALPAMPRAGDSVAQANNLRGTNLAREEETKRAIRDLLDVLPKDVLDELNMGTIDLKDPSFLDGLTDHVSRLSLASPQAGQKILGKIIKLKKLITRSLRESDPDVAVSATITHKGDRV